LQIRIHGTRTRTPPQPWRAPTRTASEHSRRRRSASWATESCGQKSWRGGRYAHHRSIIRTAEPSYRRKPRQHILMRLSHEPSRHLEKSENSTPSLQCGPKSYNTGSAPHTLISLSTSRPQATARRSTAKPTVYRVVTLRQRTAGGPCQHPSTRQPLSLPQHQCPAPIRVKKLRYWAPGSLASPTRSP
jgi:hypothetical protein